MSLWVFGYGSLVWRPDIPYDRTEPAVLHGWKRRFWQGSIDHRGVPGAPGRVVTLLPDPDERVLGRAFRVPRAEVDAVLRRLDVRERGGYERHQVSLVDLHGATLADALTYRATPENRNYLGPAPIEEIAIQVVRSTGPSGPNPEYVLRLHDALSRIGEIDEHLEAVAAAVRRLRHARAE